MHVVVERTDSLGDSSYLLSHEGFGVVIDPQRHLSPMLDLIEAKGVKVTHVFDTHVHNDYLSGARTLASRLDAALVMPAGSGTQFPFLPAFHRELLEDTGHIAILPLHTPGHTPEHTSYLVSTATGESALFSGGSLLTGAAGRCDLLGTDYARSLARLQYRSVRRLAALPPETELFPTHGAGSFCTAGATSVGSSTIGTELDTNPVLAYQDEESFVEGQLTGLLPYPDYYPHMAPMNRLGPDEITSHLPPTVDSDELAALVAAGVEAIDARPHSLYAQGHLRGSLNVTLSSSFAPWVGWLVPFGTPLALILGPGQELSYAVIELGRIGYEVVGVTFDISDLDLTTTRVAGAAELVEVVGTVPVIDVRDPGEFGDSHLAASIHCYVPDLRNGVPVNGDEVWLACASGFRAGIAAGLVERSGVRPVVVDSGGVPDALRLRPQLAG